MERLLEQGLATVVAALDDGDEQGIRFVHEKAAGSDGGPSLSLAIDARRVRAALEVPPSHARSARARVADPERALELSTALAALPEQFTLGAIGASGNDRTAQAPLCTTDDLRLLLDRIARDLAVPAALPAVLSVAWEVPRAVALEHAALLDEQLEDAIVALAEVFALLVAEPEAGAIRRRRSAGRHDRGAGAPADDDRERSKTGRGSRERDRRFRVKGRDRDGEGEGEAAEVEPEPPRELPAVRMGGQRAFSNGDGKAPPRPGLRRRSKAVSSPASVERGARVSVLKGPFSGKVGVVQELDGKGGARVMLGLLAVRLDVKNLVVPVEGRARPRLSSSHRKPLPARS